MRCMMKYGIHRNSESDYLLASYLFPINSCVELKSINIKKRDKLNRVTKFQDYDQYMMTKQFYYGISHFSE